MGTALATTHRMAAAIARASVRSSESSRRRHSSRSQRGSAPSRPTATPAGAAAGHSRRRRQIRVVDGATVHRASRSAQDRSCLASSPSPYLAGGSHPNARSRASAISAREAVLAFLRQAPVRLTSSELERPRAPEVSDRWCRSAAAPRRGPTIESACRQRDAARRASLLDGGPVLGRLRLFALGAVPVYVSGG